MILIEDTYGVVHVGQPSTDAVHWTRCGARMSDDGQTRFEELHGMMGASLRTVVVPAGRRVNRAPTCLWCVQERWLVPFSVCQEVGLGVGNVGAISRIDFPSEDAP